MNAQQLREFLTNHDKVMNLEYEHIFAYRFGISNRMRWKE